MTTLTLGMNQGLVCPFGLKLCQNVATGSRNPLECLRTPKTVENKKINDFSIFPPSPLSPLIPLLALCGLIGLLALWGAPPAQFTLVFPFLGKLPIDRCAAQYYTGVASSRWSNESINLQSAEISLPKDYLKSANTKKCNLP